MQNPRFAASLTLFVLGLATLGYSQLAQTSPHRTLGYFNSDTGLFEPLAMSAQEETLSAVAPTTGTLVFNFTITLKSTLPKNGIITCSASGAVIETAFSADEGNFGVAKLVSGNTYSCSVSMPYSWLLNTPGTDKIILSYKAQINEGLEIIAANGTANTVLATAARFSSQTTASIPVPANGATTTKPVSITL